MYEVLFSKSVSRISQPGPDGTGGQLRLGGKKGHPRTLAHARTQS